MSGSYRLQPPSPFPYSGGSRMEQALVPALQGNGGNAMLGYVLGSQFQRQADQMNYEREMGEYNLTAQQEGERARQEAAELRREQMQHNLTAAAVNSGGPGFLPESYSLTPQQRELANADSQARVSLRTAQAERAGRVGTGSGDGTVRIDPYTRMELGSLFSTERQLSTQLSGLMSRETGMRRELANIFNPQQRAAAEARINEQLAAERTRITEQLGAVRTRREELMRGRPAGNAAPTAQPTVPQSGASAANAAPSGEVVPPPATAQAPTAPPRSTSEALQRQLITPDQLARARSTGQIVRIEPDGTIVTRNQAGEQRIGR